MENAKIFLHTLIKIQSINEIYTFYHNKNLVGYNSSLI